MYIEKTSQISEETFVENVHILVENLVNMNAYFVVIDTILKL